MDVCLSRLVAGHANDYQDQTVRVAGYLELQPNSDALFLSAHDEKEGRVERALWIELRGKLWKEAKKLTRNYVVLEGAFDGKRSGPTGTYAGTLSDIRKATILSPAEVLQLDSKCTPPAGHRNK